MFTLKPILWLDVDRVAPEDVKRVIEQYHQHAFILPVLGDGNKVVGSVLPGRYPTMDELFRWKPSVVRESYAQVDPATVGALVRGKWQAMIPTAKDSDVWTVRLMRHGGLVMEKKVKILSPKFETLGAAGSECYELTDIDEKTHIATATWYCTQPY
jgi:hypothetical protein